MSDILQDWAQRIQLAASSKTPLRFRGGGTKDFYSQSLEGEVFDTRAYAGILSYEPSELVVTVCAGTPLKELETALAEKANVWPLSHRILAKVPQWVEWLPQD